MAVYTEVGDDELASFLESYGVGRLLSYKGIAEGVENTNYVVHATGGTFILTLYEKRVDPADLPYFLGLTEHLSQRGVPCPVAVRDRDGRNLREIAGRHAALVTFIEGFWHRKPLAAHCESVGRALAVMHLAGRDFGMRRANGLGLEGWKGLYQKFSDLVNKIIPGLQTVIASELKFLDANWPGALPEGVIHADLFPDNVFFIGNNLSGLIDFYFACNDGLAYDVAICLNAWCFESDGSYNAAKGRALLAGYDAVRPLSVEEREALPVLARGAALRFLLTRSYDWINTPPNAMVSRKDPNDYLLRLKFHQAARSIGDYLQDNV